ncbi:hypothetical protein [Tenacibaculum sp. M341]|uniref:hypothetical protein n=1 Tax=Tenacibaculum sp. M341 TaxID=2530339 RepID=UPI00104CD020|nr:hypothetical protein [Tenacibaculum sp. M341]TCI90595.1 hypothetical protein EYW44_12775 [Tenacibaculum sp. M341]
MKNKLITAGSISRQKASESFPFLQEKYRGRRKDIKDFTHSFPEFVFWIYPDGTLFNAKDAHKKNVPKGYDFILNDEPNYGGFLRGRLARQFEEQLIVVYCEPEALSQNIHKMHQFLKGIHQIPLPIAKDTLVISDNGDMYGSIEDIEVRIQTTKG